jgi:hypothetical protein
VHGAKGAVINPAGHPDSGLAQRPAATTRKIVSVYLTVIVENLKVFYTIDIWIASLAHSVFTRAASTSTTNGFFRTKSLLLPHPKQKTA